MLGVEPSTIFMDAMPNLAEIDEEIDEIDRRRLSDANPPESVTVEVTIRTPITQESEAVNTTNAMMATLTEYASHPDRLSADLGNLFTIQSSSVPVVAVEVLAPPPPTSLQPVAPASGMTATETEGGNGGLVAFLIFLFLIASGGAFGYIIWKQREGEPQTKLLNIQEYTPSNLTPTTLAEGQESTTLAEGEALTESDGKTDTNDLGDLAGSDGDDNPDDDVVNEHEEGAPKGDASEVGANRSSAGQVASGETAREIRKRDESVSARPRMTSKV